MREHVRRRTALVVFSCAALVLATYFLTRWFAVPGYDTGFHLTWGRDLLRGDGLFFDHHSSPTPHPLPLLWGVTVGVLPAGAATALTLAATLAATAVLATLLARIGFELTGSRVAVAATVALVLASAPLVLLVSTMSADVLYAALATGGVLLTIHRRQPAAILLFMAAAMHRPEAAALAAIPLLDALRDRRTTQRSSQVRRTAVVFAAGVLIVSAAWLIQGAIGGDLFIALNSAATNAAEHDNPRGMSAALTQALPALSMPLGPVVALSALGVLVFVVATTYRRHRREPAPERRRQSAVISQRDRAALLVGAFVAISLVMFLAQGLLGTPLVARYLLVPALLLGPLALTAGPLIGRRLPKATHHGAAVTGALVLVVSTALANLAAWTDTTDAWKLRGEVFDQAHQLLSTDLARRCPGPLAVRSPAVIAIAARETGRPLHEIHLAVTPTDETTLQPLTHQAAELAGYGPTAAVEYQALFPQGVSLRDGTTHWALYSNCTLDAQP